MTEQEWLACTDPQKMLEFLHGEASERKLRLFTVACCRQVWHLITDKRSRRAVEVAERFADGQATEKQRAKADDDSYRVPKRYPASSYKRDIYMAVGWCVSAGVTVGEPLPLVVESVSQFLEMSGHLPTDSQANLLRDIFGNLFRPTSINPAWLAWNDRPVQKISQAIYEEHAFDRLPILADALEEAGCTNADILNHCRQPGEHVRGCWVVDLLLGKS